MYLSKQDILETSKIKRLNIINSVSGIKPANLIGTMSKHGISNLAIFSSVVHLGSNPALLGFILRPQQKVRRDTYNNIMHNQCYTINHIHTNHTHQAHYTSAKFGDGVSEFSECRFDEEFLMGFEAPYVKQCSIKIGLKLVETLPIKSNNCMMIIGSVEHLFIPDELISDEGYVDLDQNNGVGIGGLNTYYKLEKVAQYPYARVNELPDFK